MERKFVSLDEQETVINMEPRNREAEIYSCDPKVVKKLTRYLQENPEDCHLISDDGYGICVKVPVSWIKYRPVKKRVMTDEQKAAAADRLRSARANR